MIGGYLRKGWSAWGAIEKGGVQREGAADLFLFPELWKSIEL
jgi:hypothetical protein